jgi:hypothetical protein
MSNYDSNVVLYDVTILHNIIIYDSFFNTIITKIIENKFWVTCSWLTSIIIHIKIRIGDKSIEI